MTLIQCSLLLGKLSTPTGRPAGAKKKVKGQIRSNHVIGVCLPSQSASEKHNQEEKAHMPLRAGVKKCLPC